ncbi:MAG: cyclic nucleotide-binding/CBS domain-containing protein [Hyphomicrobiales bacterium]|nr:cyclic nucleotide-binding/CBS domain-containing protein [Hyphomicrobiales bacterium]
MPNAFDAANPPFDRLTPGEIEMLRAAIDVGYFKPGATIVRAGGDGQSLFIIIKGAVEEREGDELVGLLGPKDFFDTRAIVQGAAAHSFVAREETLCYLAPKDVIQRLIRDNARFGAFFYLDISRKLEAIARTEDEMRSGSLMRTRIGDLFLHPAEFIDATATIEQAGRRMREINSNTLLLRDAGQGVGIVTGMNLSKAVVLHKMPITAPIAPLAHFDLSTVAENDFVFEALLEMTKSNKRRLAVKRGDEFVGILEDIDLLGFLAGNTQVIAGRIDRAKSLADLRIAAREIADQVRTLRRQDVRFETIAEIVSDLNRRLFAKTFALIAPPDLRKRGCLIVMGSEGRGEQTIRTDQDNGIILAEPVDAAMLDGFRAEFTAALEEFGYPPCPGNVMVRNPFWSKTLDEYLGNFNEWVAAPDQNAMMNVAIFYDAVAVSGRTDLLKRAKTALIESVRAERVYLARFALAVESFETPISLFNTLVATDGALDLKKGGIFPIVHGVRALALEHGLEETSTEARLEKLGELNVLRADFTRDLLQSFQYLSTLRLDSQLEELSGSRSLVRPAELSSVERDLLRDSFKVVKQFRDFLRRHFNLGMFG